MVVVAVLLVLAGCGRIEFDDTERPSCVPGIVEPATNGRLGLTDLAPVWSTPNTVALGWTHAGDDAHFTGYRLIVWTTATCQAPEILTMTEHPELGVVSSARDGFTIIDRRAPDTTYFAQLVADDDAGQPTITPIVALHTPAVTNHELVLFADMDTMGYSIPSELMLSTRAPYAGAAAYEWVNPCTSNDCFEILRRQDLKIPAPAFDATDFERAYLELAIAIGPAGPPVTYGEARLWFGHGTTTDTNGLFNLEGFWIPSTGRYVLLQLPLAQFGITTRLTFAATRAELYEFSIGGDFRPGTTVSVDEVRIRW